MKHNPLTFAYSWRQLNARRLQTFLTVSGIALVVFVFAATLMLSEGLQKTLSATGRKDNVIVLRSGSQNEIQSGVDREAANIVLSQPEVARTPEGIPLATTDVLVLVSLKTRADNQPSNVNVRGVSEHALAVRDGIQLISGRLPQRGTKELIVGNEIHRKFRGTEIGDNIRLVGTDWPVVGIFDAGATGFSSEIVGDADVLLPSFRRDRFSSVTFRLNGDFDTIRERIETDRRFSLTLEREQDFYARQSATLSKFIRIIGGFVSVIFSLGAIVGAMITMYSSVASRVREIGILRALGFSRAVVFGTFLKECLLLGVLGGLMGISLALFLTQLTVSTTNFSTFAEIAFGFSMTSSIALGCMVFAVAMGFLGGALPAWRASRMNIIQAIRGQ